MIGYIRLYVKVSLVDNWAYAKYESDFTIIPTEEWFDAVLNSFKVYYSRFGTVVDVQFVTEEEYKNNVKGEFGITLSWDERRT